MLGKLKTGAGYWHELAKLLPALQRLGFDAQAVELATGLERPLQSVWAISEQVRLFPAACRPSRWPGGCCLSFCGCS